MNKKFYEVLFSTKNNDKILKEFNKLSIEVKKRVNSINYQLGIDNYKLFWATYYICSEDWYLKLDFRGVDGYCLDKDPRALEEFNSVKKRLEEYINNKDTDGPISINDLLSNKDYNSAKYQQLVLKKKIDKLK